MHELAALGAALCWALTGVLSAGPASTIGPFAFGLYRQSMVASVLALLILGSGGWGEMSQAMMLRLAASGVVGVFLGDTILYLSLIRLGPRRTGALFALNAPIAAILGWLTLGEQLAPQAWGGVALCTAGVAVAVLGRPGRSGGHAFEAIRGPVWIGVTFGLLAATGQALGSLIARPAMAAGADPLSASLIRVTVSVAGLALLMSLPVRAVKPKAPLTRMHLMQIFASGFIAMVVGMTLLLYALQGGKVGIVSTLSALSPVLILPVLWATTGARPSATSWAGALIATAGMAMIFLR